MSLFEKLIDLRGWQIELRFRVGDKFSGLASGWHDEKMCLTVELICLVATHLIEQCIDALHWMFSKLTIETTL